MENDEKQKFLLLVYQNCNTFPDLVPEVIQAATEGVQAFAKRQRDESGEIQARMIDLIDNNKSLKSKYFSQEEIFDCLKMAHGTTWFEENKNKEKIIQKK